MFKRIVIFIFFAFISGVCFSQDLIELEEIVVTPYSGMGETDICSTPYSAQIYTEEDIARTGAATVLDFLKIAPAVNVSDYYGTNVKTTVDMMGFGDNAGSNILVLVDGRRINDIDMSGVDWTQLSLKNIAKIEVIKGGGGVLYGDNADGGVINVFSKEAIMKGFISEINFEAGSYRYTKESIALSGGEDKLSFYSFSEYHSTDGYRQNSHYRSKYSSLKLDSRLSDDLGVTFELGHHKYVYGLPDDITEAESLSGHSRRDSTTPLNNVQREDDTLGITVKNEFSPNFSAAIDLFYRNRNELEELLSYGMTTDKHVTNIQIKSQALFSFDSGVLKHEAIGGFEFYACDLSSDTVAPWENPSTDIDRRTLAWFIQDDISLSEQISFRFGSRLQKEKFTFDYIGNTNTYDGLSFTEELYEAGVNYKLTQKTNTYLNFSRGLRVGKTDEYLVTYPSASVNTELTPQNSKIVTIGINSKLNKLITTSLSCFKMNIDDEIYYDPSSWTNANYDKTRRQGATIDISLSPFDCLGLNFGYRFIDAEFRRGSYNGKKVPFVPKSVFTASLKYDFLEHFSIFFDYLYRGKTYLINDMNNISPKLKSYNVTNMKLSYTKGDVELFAGIKNLFNELYSEYAATNIGGTTRGFYPSPERNYFGGLKINF